MDNAKFNPAPADQFEWRPMGAPMSMHEREEEYVRLRLAAFVAFGALKALAPKDSEAVKFLEGLLWPRMEPVRVTSD